MKKRRNHLLLLTALLVLTGCGHVKSSNQLIRMAKSAHGACTVVSKNESADNVTVTLLDEKQGFTYTVKSYMSSLSIDGSSFGSYPETRDTFAEALIDYVYAQSEPELLALFSDNGSSFDPDFLNLTVRGDADPQKLGEAVCAVLQKQNEDHRLDELKIRILDAKKNHVGSCSLPDCKFMTREEEKDAFFLAKANEKMNAVAKKNRSITFLRKEVTTFDQAGIPVDCVMENYEGNHPEQASAPVTLYYYKTKSQEFYIADFLDNNTYNWYTNFDLSLEKKKKGILHVNVNIS